MRSTPRQLVLVAAVVALALAPAAAPAAAIAGDVDPDRPSSGCASGPVEAIDPAADSVGLSIETFVAPGASYDRLTSPGALETARANGTLTRASVGVDRTYEDDVVAYRDVVVHRVTLNGSATAFADRLAATDGSTPSERFRALVANGTVEFGYVGPTACPPELALNATLDRGAVRVVPDPAADVVWFVLDTDRLLFHPLGGGEPTTDTRVHGHHGFDLGLPASGGLVSRDVRAGSDYEVDPAVAELASRHPGVVRLAPAADQALRGQTTLAPGSEITVRLVPYVGAADPIEVRATVDPSRRFAATVDLGDVPDGALYAVGYESMSEPPVVDAGATLVAVGNASGAIVEVLNETSDPSILYNPALTTTHGGFVAVRNASGGLVGVSEYREPGASVVQIELEPALARSQRVTVTVYRDVNGNRAFDGADVPYRVNGTPVRDTAFVRVEGDPPGTVDPVTTTGATRTPPVTTDPAPQSPTTSAGPRTGGTATPGQPGFGALAAAVGILTALGLGRRRRR